MDRPREFAARLAAFVTGHRNAIRASALAAALLAAASPAQPQGFGADPFVFVLDRDESGRAGSADAWWLLEKVIRPTGTIVSGIPLDRINEALGAGSAAWCYANVFTPRSFVSPSRRIQREIDTSLSDGGESLFRRSAAFTGETMQDAVVGNYETCGGALGAFLLITDRAEPRTIVYVHRFEDWDGLIWMSQYEDGLAVHSCFECGHAEALVFDRGRRQFRWQDIGD